MRRKLCCILAALILLNSLLTVPATAEEEHSCGLLRAVSYVDGYQLSVKCAKCTDYIYPQRVFIDLADGTTFCKTDYEVPISDNGWSDISSVGYVVLYEGVGDTSYDVSTAKPEAKGDYRVFLAFEQGWLNDFDNLAEYSTTPIQFSIVDHEWVYSSDQYSLYAHCANCEETAKVSLDATAVYELSKRTDYKDAGIELFYEENWTCHDNLERYVVEYNGVGIKDDGKEKNYKNSKTSPEYPGSYTVRLSLPKNGTTVKKDLATTDMPFYFTGIPIIQCEVVSFTDKEKAELTKPRIVGNNYYVGTASELYWCSFNMKSNMNIYIINDIVVNPIVITDNQNISCGAKKIYKWNGFGYNYNKFDGCIYGGGHTVFGLYQSENRAGDWVVGLVSWGRNAEIKDLTVENSYLKASNAVGAIAGEISPEGSTDTSVINCKSLHNLLVSEHQAGGVVGWLSTERSKIDDSYYTIRNCVNNSTVIAPVAGGILGQTCSSNVICGGIIQNCRNYGSITATNIAGGIVGSITIWHHIGVEIVGCLNTGYIKADNYESGILGELNINSSGGALLKGGVNISNNVNLGEFYFNCTNVADILSSTGSNLLYRNGWLKFSDLLKLNNNYFTSEETAYPSSLTNVPEGIRLSRFEVNNGHACEVLGGHIAADCYSNTTLASCEGGGCKEICCVICGAVMETVETSPHGHCLQNGTCIYCGEKDPSGSKGLGASVFSDGSWIVITVVAVLLVGTAITVVVFKKRKKKEIKE